MTLSAVFDESGKWNDSERVVFAGFVGQQDKWVAFTHDWNVRLCGDLPLGGRDNPVFHMVELNRAHRMMTDDAEKVKLELLVADLARVICKYVVEGFAHVVSMAEFNALRPEQKKRYKDPFYYAFEAGVKSITQIGVLRPHDNVMLICDDSEEYSAECLKSYRRLKRLEPDISKRIPCITFADDKYYAPLQAADMYAYCIRAQRVGATAGLWNEPLEIIHSYFSEHVHSDILLNAGEVKSGNRE
jgi:hypothetical protein